MTTILDTDVEVDVVLPRRNDRTRGTLVPAHVLPRIVELLAHPRKGKNYREAMVVASVLDEAIRWNA